MQDEEHLPDIIMTNFGRAFQLSIAANFKPG